MNLSLYQLKKKLKLNKQAQGSLMAIVLGGVVLSTLIASGTSWYLTMRHNLGDTEDKLEAQTIAQSEWERLSHMSLDELEANRNVFKNPYSAGTDSQFSVSVNLGQKGTFNNGTCGAVSGGYANCFKDTTITVYRDGNRMFTTRTLPLMAGDYTRKEIDDKLVALTTKINNNSNAITNLTNRLNGKEFIKNRTPNYDLNLRYEKKAGEDGFSLHAYNGNTEIPLSSQADSPSPDIFTDKGGYYKFPNGLIMQWGYIPNINVEASGAVNEGYYKQEVYFPVPFPHKCLNVQTTVNYMNQNDFYNSNGWTGVVRWNKNSFLPYSDFADGIHALIGCFWLAIGY